MTQDEESRSLARRVAEAVRASVEAVPGKDIRLTVNVMLTGMNGHILIGDDAIRDGVRLEQAKFAAIRR